MYVLLIIGFLVIFRIEQREWCCSNPYEIFEECKKDDAMSFRGSKPNESDDVTTLLDKIEIASNGEVKHIKWRRAFIMACIICIVIYALVITPGELPQWTTMYTIILLTFVIIYFHLNSYSHHKFSKEYISDSIKLLKQKLDL